jgi:hypothetical protein
VTLPDAAYWLAAQRAQLVEVRKALRKGREYVAASHGLLKCVAGDDNLIKPDLDMVDAAIRTLDGIIDE